MVIKLKWLDNAVQWTVLLMKLCDWPMSPGKPTLRETVAPLPFSGSVTLCTWPRPLLIRWPHGFLKDQTDPISAVKQKQIKDWLYSQEKKLFSWNKMKLNASCCENLSRLVDAEKHPVELILHLNQCRGWCHWLSRNDGVFHPAWMFVWLETRRDTKRACHYSLLPQISPSCRCLKKTSSFIFF